MFVISKENKSKQRILFGVKVRQTQKNSFSLSSDTGLFCKILPKLGCLKIIEHRCTYLCNLDIFPHFNFFFRETRSKFSNPFGNTDPKDSDAFF